MAESISFAELYNRAKAGHHDTTVHESVAPAVVNEQIERTRLNEEQKVVDREVHQEHFHTTIQPVKDREVLPERHEHRMGEVINREEYHGDDAAIKARLEREAAQFRSTRVEGETRESTTVAPTVAGEHVHHHVYEKIQPVVQKEIIQPSVVHTTVPIHEVHHNEPRHHAASALPAVSMADFKKQGGVLGGREERFDRFEGEPKGISTALGDGLGSREGVTGTHHHNHKDHTAGPHNSDTLNKMDPRVDSDLDGSRNMGAANTQSNTTGTGYGSSGLNGSARNTAGPHNSDTLNKMDPRVDSDMDGSRTTGTSGLNGSTNRTTAGLHNSDTLNKMDPRVDSDRDGSRTMGGNTNSVRV